MVLMKSVSEMKELDNSYILMQILSQSVQNKKKISQHQNNLYGQRHFKY